MVAVGVAATAEVTAEVTVTVMVMAMAMATAVATAIMAGMEVPPAAGTVAEAAEIKMAIPTGMDG